MKKILISAVLILTTAATAQADQYLKINKGIKGLLLGAGGGAIAGQAIGRDTQSTLIGTTIGTLVGYMVGNEMDKNSIQFQDIGYQPRYEPRYQELPTSYRNDYRPLPNYQTTSGACREVEILGTVHGAPEKIITTACQTPEGWILVEPPPESAAEYRYSPREYLPRRSVNSGYRPRNNHYDQRVTYQY
ncbi:MAG: glycine zipper domain-containing protein [Desulfocapsaceae bacterium]